ncbi:MAG: DNA gyrase inhibitor YacG [SAR324 cluster bacterium]|nr:DNA gyrase inhibitor YacG [SAR324 cluster bacterium]
MNQKLHEKEKTLFVNCPKCRKLVEWATSSFRPFCSKRCQTLDQAGWASEEYQISSLPDESPPSEDIN